jgi:hypothetical protein
MPACHFFSDMFSPVAPVQFEELENADPLFGPLQPSSEMTLDNIIQPTRRKTGP